MITFPAQHSWWQVSNDDGLLETLPIYFQTRNFRVPDDGFLLVTGDSVPDQGYRHMSDATSLFLDGIDPGTHFWKLELRAWNNLSSTAAETTLHVEIVVDPSNKNSPWSYKLREDETKPTVLFNPDMCALCTREVLPVCYVSSTSSAFDGQRRMWLQIMEGLSKVDFQFEVKTFERVVTDTPFARALRRLNVSVEGLPIEIARNELPDEEATSDGASEALLQSFYRQFSWAKNDSRQIMTLDQQFLSKLQPPFAARIWSKLVDSLASCSDGLIVFSNSRSLSDELLVLAARLAGPRAIVMELANLHPTRVDVDVLLAPSHFAKEHYSIVRNVRAHNTFVLSTGVDTQKFTPTRSPISTEEHFVIGYVGRLSSEKSLGILLAAMKNLAPICPRCSLRIIGDGPQKIQLKELAAEWGLLGASVEFVNGIYNEEALVRTLRGMHVFASPMFTETLGLAVLEAMSVGLPVVGFISAGTGEFLVDNLNCIAVTKATPDKFTDALLLLVKDRERRLRLGDQARRTVNERFSTRIALEQYAKLYKRIGRSSCRGNGKTGAPRTGDSVVYE